VNSGNGSKHNSTTIHSSSMLGSKEIMASTGATAMTCPYKNSSHEQSSIII